MNRNGAMPAIFVYNCTVPVQDPERNPDFPWVHPPGKISDSDPAH
jgi:hypothetical protein